ncbi:Zinc finger protein 622 [Eumeta japonica]|uniref:Zinc finger protein 622 n=1 Tax=Eumeta variegata TaxID=151549 RepID=A0A4C1XX31_EUMVA|nr:Zinc finger protein 622 [Eumeta japonica]
MRKKHKLAQEKYLDVENVDTKNSYSDPESFVIIEAQERKDYGKFILLNANNTDEDDIETDSEIEELDSDEWEECHIKESDSLIQPQDCLFCAHHSKTIVKNLKHMSVAHSFFIPDVEFCVDLKGLLLYLGEKISQGFMCLWCNETGRTFYSMEAARAHMIDKGHCKMLHEGIALADSSYPENTPGEENMDVDEAVGPTVLDGDDFQLVLPSGITVGHRSLMRYYKQNLTQSSQALVNKSDRKLHRLLGVYRALGWNPKEQALAARKAKDIHFMKRVQAKWQMKLSMKANKLQKHFRPQVNF